MLLIFEVFYVRNYQFQKKKQPNLKINKVEAELLEEDKEDYRSVNSTHSLDDKHSSDKRVAEVKIASFLETEDMNFEE